MKKQVCLLLSGLLLAGCAGQHHRPPAGMAGNLPPPDLRAWLTPTDNQDDGISDTRRQMLTDAGRTLGFRGGKAQRSWELIQALNARESTLNALYDFRPLISREGWLVPRRAGVTGFCGGFPLPPPRELRAVLYRKTAHSADSGKTHSARAGRKAVTTLTSPWKPTRNA